RRLRQLQVRELAAEHRARPRMPDRLIERAPGEAERRGAHGSAKDVERAHRELESIASGTEQRARGDAAAFEREPGDRMRRDQVEALRHAEAGRIGRYDERRDTARARVGARPRQKALPDGDTAAWNPRL